MHNSRLIVEDGLVSIGYLPGLTYGFRDNCRLRLENSTVRIKGGAQIRPGVAIWAMNAEVEIGDGTVVNGPTHIVAKARIRIGSFCQIARNATIMDCDLHKHADAGEQPQDIGVPVTIGNHCWIGHSVTILKGVTLGDGSVIAAHSVVVQDVEPRTLVAGVPARKVKANIKWE